MTARRARARRALAAAGLLLVVAVAFTGMAEPADARGWRRSPALVCGELPTVDVVLRSDLTCPTGFHFGPSDVPVEIDLRGHTLTVPGDAGSCTAPGPCGAIAGAAAVRNGAVVGTLTDIGEVTSVLVRGDVALRLGFSGAGGPATLRRSIVLDGTVQVWGPSVSVTDNIIRGAIDLVSTNAAIRDVTVTGNWVLQSPRAGISVAPQFGNFPDDVDGTISRNVVWGSAGAGIDLRGGLWNLGALDIDHNLLVANGASGFQSGTSAPGPPSAQGGPVTLTGNVAIFNGGRGIEANWTTAAGTADVTGTGLVDGGANRAAANAVQPECVGVAC